MGTGCHNNSASVIADITDMPHIEIRRAD
jgi:hypothetical protein